MGLSSSQARLLSLTGRMHDIEYKAQKLEAQKLQMANESDHVYKEYENALNATKIQFKTIGADGSASFIDATYNLLTNAGYTIKLEGEEKEVVDSVTAQNFVIANGNKEYFKALQTSRVSTTNQKVGEWTEIYTLDQLKSISGNGKYRLMADINADGEDFQLTLNNGTFDGNGHSIYNLKKALFSNITNNSVVSNLNISGDSTTKGLLADTVSSSQVKNINATGAVYNSTANNVGGLIGNATNATIEQCSTNVSVNGDYRVGGLVGYLTNSTVNNCSASGTINANSLVGGLIGQADTSNFTNSSAATNITLGSATTSVYLHAGGFIGNLTNGSNVSNCQSSGSITNNNTYSYGGLAGFIGQSWNGSSSGYNTVTISNSNSSTNIINNVPGPGSGKVTLIGGFIGDLNSGLTDIDNCNFTGTITNNAADTSNLEIGGFGGRVADSSSALAGHVTIDNCYTNNTNYNFVANTANITVNESPSYVTNNITVTPPAINTAVTVDNSGADAAGSLFDRMTANGYTTMAVDDPRIKYGDDSNWFSNMLNAGLLFLFKHDQEGNEYQVNVATDTNLQEVPDDLNLKKAEAKYEADMRKIDAKDKKYDTELASLENERNAIKTEIDTLKNIAKDNVDRTFKLFS